MTPQYVSAFDQEGCYFDFVINATREPDEASDYVFDKNDFLLRSEPIIYERTKYNRDTYQGKSVFYVHGKWMVEESKITVYNYRNSDVLHYVAIECHLQQEPEACVFPIDPAITEIDINGAIGPYKNPTNTGWLFKHAEREDHHDREVLTEAIIVAVFEPEVADKNVRVLSAIVNGRQSNQQLGELNNYNTLIEFRKDVLKYAIAQERVMYIGQHVHLPDEHHLSKMALKAVNGVKQIWASTKSRELDGMSAELGRIISRLQHRHGYQTRWQKQAAAKKKAAAESETPAE